MPTPDRSKEPATCQTAWPNTEADHRGVEGGGGRREDRRPCPAARHIRGDDLQLEAKYGGMEVSEAKRLRSLKDENAKLKRLLADAMLDNAALKDLLTKKW